MRVSKGQLSENLGTANCQPIGRPATDFSGGELLRDVKRGFGARVYLVAGQEAHVHVAITGGTAAAHFAVSVGSSAGHCRVTHPTRNLHVQGASGFEQPVESWNTAQQVTE